MEYKLILKTVINLCKKDNIDFRKSDVLTIASDSNRSYLYQGKFYSPHVDTIEDDYFKLTGNKPVSISRISSRIKGNLAYGDVYAPDGLFSRALVQKRIKGLLSSSNYPYSNWEEKAWGKVLDLVEPKKVIGVLPSRELCQACHDRGIWVADVQHGVIAKNHPWYGAKWRTNDPNSQIPDVFYVWDQQSKEVITEWCTSKNSTVSIIGNRWIARFLDGSIKDDLVHAAKIEIRDYFESKALKPKILVTLSWGESDIPKGEVPPEILKVINETYQQFHWFVRLHPNQISGFASHEFKIFLKHFEEKLKGKAEWEISTKSALPSVLSEIDIHLSWMSSVAIEAAHFGIVSGLLSNRLRNELKNDYFNLYTEKGIINFLENDKTAIIKFINGTINRKFVQVDYEQYNLNYKKLINFLAE